MARTQAQLADNFRESDFLTLASLLGIVPFEALCNALTSADLRRNVTANCHWN